MRARMASACVPVPVSPLKCGLNIPRECVRDAVRLAMWNPAPAHLLVDRDQGLHGRLCRTLHSMDPTMRWEQAIVYAVGALMLIGVAASVFQLYGAALLLGCILMVLSLADGPRGLKLLLRDVKRHVVGP